MNKLFLYIVIFMTITTSCNNGKTTLAADTAQNAMQGSGWEQALKERMPYLGHRNWIVITDMAYPLQSGSGITTLYADEPYTTVLSKVKNIVDAAPHVFAHVWRDRELAFIPESDVSGIVALRDEMDKICGGEVVCLPHEELIGRLDEAGRLFNVVIIKTPLTVPYTSTFFELDCKYWDAARQERLDKRLTENN